MWQFAQACEGIKRACSEMDTPVVSGNVSLYNETNGVSVYPTPAIAMVGLNENSAKVLDSSFRAEGNALLLIGDTKGEFGGSLYMKEICGTVAGSIPDIDFASEARLWEFVIEANRRGLLESAKDINVGGIAMAAVKMACVGGIGVDIDIPMQDSRWIFDESQSRAFVEVKQENVEQVATLGMDLGLRVQMAGKVGGDIVRINTVSMPLSELSYIYHNSFKETIEQDL
jgi:phosphoribosylformylglycinamidine synthase